MFVRLDLPPIDHRFTPLHLVSAFVEMRLVLLGLLSLTYVAAWGSVGHEMVATVAQALLHTDVRAYLCTMLPSNSSYDAGLGDGTRYCHLAPIASWADWYKEHEPRSTSMHYVNALGDAPPLASTYGHAPFRKPDHILRGTYPC